MAPTASWRAPSPTLSNSSQLGGPSVMRTSAGARAVPDLANAAAAVVTGDPIGRPPAGDPAASAAVIAGQPVRVGSTSISQPEEHAPSPGVGKIFRPQATRSVVWGTTSE